MQDHVWVIEGKRPNGFWAAYFAFNSRQQARDYAKTIKADTRIRKFIAA